MFSSASTCPKCGRAVAGRAPLGLCPKCLLDRALGRLSEADTDGGEETDEGGFMASLLSGHRFGDYEILELSTNPAGLFTGIASYTNILGNNQTVLYPSSASSNLFFRGRVSLQGP